MAAWLLILALTAAATADPAGPAAADASFDADPWSSPEVAAPRMDARPLKRSPDARAWSGAADPGEAGGTPWFRSTLALGGVVALILLLAWGYRRVAGAGTLGLALRARHPGLVEIVSRTTLSPRQSVCLVRVGPRLVLVGCTPDSLRALDVIHDADLAARLVGQVAQGRSGSHVEAFERCLEEQSGAFAGSGAEDDEALAPDETRLGAVQEKLTGTIDRLRRTLVQA
jgi:flagellar biogenesis protein FliO